MVTILIPSNDCLTIAPDFENANSFRLMTIKNRTIQEDSIINSFVDLKEKYLSGLRNPGDNTLAEVNNPDSGNLRNGNNMNRKIILVSQISIEAEKNIQKINYEVIHTEETNIFNAIFSFLENDTARDSYYCCCP